MKDDLISRAALLEDIRSLAKYIARVNGGVDDVTIALKEAFDMVKAAPAVDAEPVRHAAWVYEIDFENESKRDDFDVTCTGCGALFRADNRDDAEIVIMDRWDYCPFCGAKMDLEVQHE